MVLNKYKLCEIAQFNKSSVRNSDELTEIEYLDTSSITENVISSTYRLKLKDAPSRAQRKVSHNTILYSTVRPRLKHYGILSNPKQNLIVSTGFVTIDIKNEFKDKIDARFLYLLLTQPCVTEYIGGIADTAVSAYPSINPSDISSLSFNFPKIEKQKYISNIWYSLDRKIKLNHQINDNLPLLDRSSKEAEVRLAA